MPLAKIFFSPTRGDRQNRAGNDAKAQGITVGKKSCCLGGSVLAGLQSNFVTRGCAWQVGAAQAAVWGEA